jgi:hypothetical protein
MALVPYYGGFSLFSREQEPTEKKDATKDNEIIVIARCYNFLQIATMYGSSCGDRCNRFNRRQFLDATTIAAEEEQHIQKQKTYIQHVIQSLSSNQRKRKQKKFILSRRGLNEIQKVLPNIQIRSIEPCSFTRRKRLLVVFESNIKVVLNPNP